MKVLLFSTYQDRIAFAEQAGLIACTNTIRPKRRARRFRLLIPPKGSGQFYWLTDSIIERDLRESWVRVFLPDKRGDDLPPPQRLRSLRVSEGASSLACMQSVA